jgi:hypothetical protein
MTLEKGFRERLKRQTWLAANKHRRNKYEVVSDYRRYMMRDLQDLTILAAKAPENLLEDVFTPERVSQFLGSLLQRNQERERISELVDKVNALRKPIIDLEAKLNDKTAKLSSRDRQTLQEELSRLDREIPWWQADEELKREIEHLDVRRAHLANLMVQYGTRYLIDKYANLEQELPIRSLAVKSLLEAEQLAGSIVSKVAAATAASSREGNGRRKG